MTMGGLNDTPRGSRLHLALFGRRNAGKSSLINALTNQQVAIVSGVPGTTTDPVYKSMEILPVGPVVVIDTAGIDDTGLLGSLRVEQSLKVLTKADLLLLVLDLARSPGGEELGGGGQGGNGRGPENPVQEDWACERELLSQAREQKVLVVGVLNKADLAPARAGELAAEAASALGIPVLPVSAVTRQGVEELKKEIIKAAPKEWTAPTILGDLINPGDTVVLVVPIDLAAPKGRLILPQVQTLRDILDNDACALMVKERELKKALGELGYRPKLVVTDSQVFLKVDADTPKDIMLTSFSILFARYKGNLESLAAGARVVEDLKPGDRVLIAEACTHHRVEDDIGTVKIPRWLRQRVGGELQFSWSSGIELPWDLEQYKLVVHCGACMINRREMLNRLMQASMAGVPMVNYGVLIAYLHGILPRVLSPFPGALAALER